MWILLISIAVFAFGSCDSGAKPANTNGTNTNSGNANTGVKPATDVKSSVVALEKKAWEAWKGKDGKFFEENLTDGFVGINTAGRMTGKAITESITKSPCEVKSTSLSDEKRSRFG